MSQKRLWVAATIIALVVLVGFVLSVPRTGDTPNALTAPVIQAEIPAVVIRDIYKKGVHTISGSLMAPDACSAISATATLEGSASSTQEILVAVALETGGGVCLQLPTRMTFETTVAAPAQLPLVVTVGGERATTTAP